jgi:hypothetical protein
MHHDRSGTLVRLAIIAALLGAAAWGYMRFADGEQTAGLVPAKQEQRMAEAQAPGAPEIAQPTEPAAPLAQSPPAAGVPAEPQALPPPTTVQDQSQSPPPSSP